MTPYTQSNPLRIFSSGGGQQSVAVAVLQATGRIPPYDYHIFANVGEKAENPKTLAYVQNYLAPYLEEHNIGFIEVRKRNRKGEIVDLYDAVMDTSKKSVIIPAYLGQGGATNRICTNDWKIVQVDKAVKALGGAYTVVGLGISLDEFERVRSTEWHDAIISKTGKRKPLGFWKQREYPLITLRLTRADCVRIIRTAGLPIPPPSSCFYCPFKRKAEWIRLRAEEPELFAQAVALEDALNAKGLHQTGKHAGKKYYLSTFKKPLRDIPDQLSLFAANADLDCDSGYCHT